MWTCWSRSSRYRGLNTRILVMFDGLPIWMLCNISISLFLSLYLSLYIYIYKANIVWSLNCGFSDFDGSLTLDQCWLDVGLVLGHRFAHFREGELERVFGIRLRRGSIGPWGVWAPWGGIYGCEIPSESSIWYILHYINQYIHRLNKLCIEHYEVYCVCDIIHMCYSSLHTIRIRYYTLFTICYAVYGIMYLWFCHMPDHHVQYMI